eukprot:GEMP01028018.1.p1 GENE.GEMP01028018.1~~GEMP01028018.1.p1  ORF type:complete len:338 (+),score=56.96 GEMP01028018.1:96-1109(+)
MDRNASRAARNDVYIKVAGKKTVDTRQKHVNGKHALSSSSPRLKIVTKRQERVLKKGTRKSLLRSVATGMKQHVGTKKTKKTSSQRGAAVKKELVVKKETKNTSTSRGASVKKEERAVKKETLKKRAPPTSTMTSTMASTMTTSTRSTEASVVLSDDRASTKMLIADLSVLKLGHYVEGRRARDRSLPQVDFATGRMSVLEMFVDREKVKFNKYSGWLEFQNAVCLFVNAYSAFDNCFRNEGSEMTWFVGGKHPKTAPILKRLTNPDETVLLFSRTKAILPFIYMGKLRCLSCDPDIPGVKLTFALLDSAALRKMELADQVHKSFPHINDSNNDDVA